MSEKPRLIIVGAGDLALELYSWMELDSEDSPYVFGGYLYDEGGLDLREEGREFEILLAGSAQGFEPQTGDVLVMGLVEPVRKLQCAALLESRGGEFISFVHPTAVRADEGEPWRRVVIGPFATLGDSSSPCEFAHIGAGCCIGAEVMINRGCTLHDNVAVFRGTHFGNGVEVGASAVVGKKVAINGFAKIEPGCLVLEDVPEGGRVTREYDEAAPWPNESGGPAF